MLLLAFSWSDKYKPGKQILMTIMSDTQIRVRQPYAVVNAESLQKLLGLLTGALGVVLVATLAWLVLAVAR
jgi:hypothetical protein